MEFGAAEPDNLVEDAVDIVAWSVFWRCLIPSAVLIVIASVVVESILESIWSFFSGGPAQIGIVLNVNLSWVGAAQAIAAMFVAFGVFRVVLEDRLGKSVRGSVLVLQKAPTSTEAQRS
jgi:hypothetical protein